MAITSSGQISVNDIMTELGVSGQTALNDEDVRGLIDKSSGAEMAISEWYGAANAFPFDAPAGNTSMATLSTLATAAGWDGTTPVLMTVPTGSVLYSTNVNNAGLIVDIADSTITVNGAITGRGGSSQQAGGDAVDITVTGITIINNSGAFLAGGGGGGHGTGSPRGGRGAGGSTPGQASTTPSNGGAYGCVNANCCGYAYGTVNVGSGGPQGSGGTGGSVYHEQSCDQTGGSGFNYFASRVANGGSVLSVSQNNDGTSSQGGGGGGGWGRSGLGSNGQPGGKAIEDNGNSYTLTNNGTVYGAVT